MNNQIKYDLDSVFFPSSPITSRDLFLGRFEQIELTCDAINERGQHFVIYGERGVGKTSLANIINSQISNVVVAKVTCNRSENFRQVWAKVLAKIRFETESQGAGFLPQKTYQGSQLDMFLPDGDTIDSLDIQSVFEKLQTPLLLIFDEFDSVVDPDFKISFADTMKNLSDNASHVTIGVVGVAESVNDLIGEHPSLERCLRQIRMPRMSKDELHQIIEKGLGAIGLRIELEASSKVVDFSSGFPHYTHLLMKYAARHCAGLDQQKITVEHLNAAIAEAIRNANQSIREAYRKATIASKSKSKFEDVVAACALSLEDEFGTFAIKDIVSPYYEVTGQEVKGNELSYYVQRLCEAPRGSILTKIGESKTIRYAFRNPLLQVYVKLILDQRGSYHAPNLFVQ